ncbi:MAG: PKD domain-containing protein [Candidatus Bathyarchaeota archaeon]|nr:PKD domain-containing protein [Candidatus Bathyarchaeota archaeon]
MGKKLLTTAFFVFALTLSIALVPENSLSFAEAQVSTTPNSQSLMTWWKLNEGNGTITADSSGNNKQGTIHEATWASINGKASLCFDGSSSYVAVPSLPLTEANSLTVIAWIYSDLSQIGKILYQGDMGEFELHMGERPYDGPVSGRYPNVASFSVKLNSYLGWHDVYSQPLHPNTWHQLVGVWEKGTALRVYVDGVLAGENNSIPNNNLYNPGSSFPASLGAYNQTQIGTPSYFKGQMSNVMVYNRTLTSYEIQTLYTQFTQPTANFTVNPTVGTVDAPITFDASLSTPNFGETQTNSLTTYQWDFGDGVAVTTDQAMILHSYTSPNSYKVTLTVSDVTGKSASASKVVQAKMPSAVSILTVSSTTMGSTVSITGNLTDSKGTRINNQAVVLSYTFKGIDSWLPISSSITNEEGSYSIQWLNTATGTFSLKAEWQGNDKYFGMNNTATLSSVPCQNQQVFLIESNSTISSLGFDSAVSQLVFTTSGPSGTHGYVKAAIAKSLIDKVDNVKVYLDEKQVPYLRASTADSWLLTFNYSHSSHKITIDIPVSNADQQASGQTFSSTQQTTPKTSPATGNVQAENHAPTVIIFSLVAIAVVTGSLLTLQRKKKVTRATP